MKYNRKSNSNTTLNWILAGIGAYLVGITVAGAVKRHKTANGIGAVEKIKRRIYKEVSMAQNAGVDFSKKFPELNNSEINALIATGEQVGWKQSKRSIESGKTYAESYFNSLRRAWNAVSGVQGIGAVAYDVYDRDGNVCLSWIDVKAHVEQEPDAKTLLALPPPHVEEKKKKAKKTSKKEREDAETKERFNFAYGFIRAYLDNDAPEGEDISASLQKDLAHQIPNGDGTIYADLVVWAWAHKQFKIHKNTNVVTFINELDEKEYGVSLYSQGRIFEILNRWWKIHVEEKGRYENEDNLDDIRRALLDKAQHMHVSLPDDLYETERDNHNLSEESYGGYVKGKDRYNYLPYINWVLWVHQKYERGGDTYYPMLSFNTKKDAMKYKYGWRADSKKDLPDHGTGWKIMPVWDVPIEKITGV